MSVCCSCSLVFDSSWRRISFQLQWVLHYQPLSIITVYVVLMGQIYTWNGRKIAIYPCLASFMGAITPKSDYFNVSLTWRCIDVDGTLFLFYNLHKQFTYRRRRKRYLTAWANKKKNTPISLSQIHVYSYFKHDQMRKLRNTIASFDSVISLWMISQLSSHPTTC